jgi:hypothetical protein
MAAVRQGSTPIHVSGYLTEDGGHGVVLRAPPDFALLIAVALVWKCRERRRLVILESYVGKLYTGGGRKH